MHEYSNWFESAKNKNPHTYRLRELVASGQHLTLEERLERIERAIEVLDVHVDQTKYDGLIQPHQELFEDLGPQSPQ